MERLAYYAEIPARGPAATVLVSRRRGAFKHRYLSGKVIVDKPAFAEHYSHDVERVRSGGGYIYWVHFDSRRQGERKLALEKVPGRCWADVAACVEPLRRKLSEK